MAIWSALGGFVGAYNDSVDAERTAKLKAQAKEETFEDKKRLAEMQKNLSNQEKQKEQDSEKNDKSVKSLSEYVIDKLGYKNY